MTDKITVLGVGNILLQDEGVGVRVVEEMTRRFAFPENVEVLDGGTLGMELMRFLLGTDKLIIIDAIDGSLPPGSIYEFEKENVKKYFREKVSVHDLGIQDVSLWAYSQL
ncbi:MAG: hydrogenase expression/formation protein [Firmicutes bacterium]|nr:hydrogenase expression/formation protein [Bacillota bacterium]